MRLNRTTLVLLSGASAAVLLAGCVASDKPLSRDLGAAVRQNNAVQIADPAPTYAGPATASGARVNSAVDRYRKGQVIQPGGSSTTQIGSGSGSGSAASPRS